MKNKTSEQIKYNEGWAVINPQGIALRSTLRIVRSDAISALIRDPSVWRRFRRAGWKSGRVRVVEIEDWGGEIVG